MERNWNKLPNRYWKLVCFIGGLRCDYCLIRVRGLVSMAQNRLTGRILCRECYEYGAM